MLGAFDGLLGSDTMSSTDCKGAMMSVYGSFGCILAWVSASLPRSLAKNVVTLW